MKNIHLLPTDKPSRLAIQLDCKPKYNLQVSETEKNNWTINWEKQHLYITSNEEIKEGDWHLHYYANKAIVGKSTKASIRVVQSSKDYKKVILTTDQTLISDGVQAVDEEFLQWYVKNPTCEYVETKVEFIQSPDNTKDGFYYKIIIPQEESKQPDEEGANWQAERMYSHAEVLAILEQFIEHPTKPGYKRSDVVAFIKQFKEKKDAR